MGREGEVQIRVDICVIRSTIEWNTDCAWFMGEVGQLQTALVGDVPRCDLLPSLPSRAQISLIRETFGRETTDPFLTAGGTRIRDLIPD